MIDIAKQRAVQHNLTIEYIVSNAMAITKLGDFGIHTFTTEIYLFNF